MSAALAVISVFLIFYAYAGYPLALSVLIALGYRRQSSAFINGTAKVTVIITVRNEERAIVDKLENTLLLESPGGQAIQIIVASDCSEDGTDALVNGYAARGVELVRLESRGGKEQAQKKAVLHARGDILVFTDARIRLNADALIRFVERFRDPSVGAVSSVDVITGQEGGEGSYVKYEMWLRSLESKFSTVVGLSGSCFGVKREIAQDMRTDIPSDFALLLAARARGLVGVHAPEIVGTYQAVPSHEAEFRRKTRTVLRGITALFACREVMDWKRYGSFSWQVISHKLCRWLVPWALLLALMVAMFGGGGSMVVLLQLGFSILFALAGIGYFHEDFREKWYCKLPLFFLVVNAGIAVAWFHFFRGERSVSWTPSNKGG